MNPFSTLEKLIRSKPMVDQLEKDVNTMNKSNWKTNTLGAIALVIGLAQIWAPPSLRPKVQATASAFAAAGLLAAKDHDK